MEALLLNDSGRGPTRGAAYVLLVYRLMGFVHDSCFRARAHWDPSHVPHVRKLIDSSSKIKHVKLFEFSVRFSRLMWGQCQCQFDVGSIATRNHDVALPCTTMNSGCHSIEFSL